MATKTTSDPGTNGAGVSRVLDLDEARAARAEKNGPAPVLRFAGKDWELPLEMPADVALHAQAERIRDAVEALLGDQADEFMALRPSLPDLLELFGAISTVYGVKPGEAKASPSS